MRKLLLTLLPLALAATSMTAPVDRERTLEIIPLRNGINRADLNHDGTPDMVIVAHRENFNAHGFEATAIYVQLDEARGGLQIVPVIEQPDPLVLRTSGGADDLLEDFRLLADPERHTTILVTARRDFGDSYADSRPVTFRFYELQKNEDGIPGRPGIFFEPYRTLTTGKSYEDVTEAFRAELGLAHDGKPGLRPNSVLSPDESRR